MEHYSVYGPLGFYDFIRYICVLFVFDIVVYKCIQDIVTQVYASTYDGEDIEIFYEEISEEYYDGFESNWTGRGVVVY